jgi:hypothetical protein
MAGNSIIWFEKRSKLENRDFWSTQSKTGNPKPFILINFQVRHIRTCARLQEKPKCSIRTFLKTAHTRPNWSLPYSSLGGVALSVSVGFQSDKTFDVAATAKEENPPLLPLNALQSPARPRTVLWI